ncbi:hypothetical protein L7F22_054199 [Adiantum nelumboides]|nr:hypothetical protein [Adiantum nelumboides]
MSFGQPEIGRGLLPLCLPLFLERQAFPVLHWADGFVLKPWRVQRIFLKKSELEKDSSIFLAEQAMMFANGHAVLKTLEHGTVELLSDELAMWPPPQELLLDGHDSVFSSLDVPDWESSEVACFIEKFEACTGLGPFGRVCVNFL